MGPGGLGLSKSKAILWIVPGRTGTPCRSILDKSKFPGALQRYRCIEGTRIILSWYCSGISFMRNNHNPSHEWRKQFQFGNILISSIKWAMKTRAKLGLQRDTTCVHLERGRQNTSQREMVSMCMHREDRGDLYLTHSDITSFLCALMCMWLPDLCKCNVSPKRKIKPDVSGCVVGKDHLPTRKNDLWFYFVLLEQLNQVTTQRDSLASLTCVRKERETINKPLGIY